MLNPGGTDELRSSISVTARSARGPVVAVRSTWPSGHGSPVFRVVGATVGVTVGTGCVVLVPPATC